MNEMINEIGDLRTTSQMRYCWTGLRRSQETDGLGMCHLNTLTHW